MPPKNNIGYRPNYSNANYGAQYSCLSFYWGIYYYNCWEKSHYFTSCTKLAVSGIQHKANKQAIKKLQDTSQLYSQRPSLKLSSVPVTLAIVVSNTKEREKSGGCQINNIGDTNTIILKRPISNKAKSNFDNSLIYPTTAATQSQKPATPQAFKFKNSQSTMLQIAKPAVERNSKQAIVNRLSRNNS